MQDSSFFTGNTRADAAREVRIVVDPDSDTTPEVKVYFGREGALPTVPTIKVTAPAGLRAASTFKFGFGAASGWYKINAAVWGLGIEPSPDAVLPATVVAPSGSMTVGEPPFGPLLGPAQAHVTDDPAEPVLLDTTPVCSVVDAGGSPVTIDASTPAGTYVVRCAGGAATGYAIDTYVDGEFDVIGSPDTDPDTEPVITPVFTG